MLPQHCPPCDTSQSCPQDKARPVGLRKPTHTLGSITNCSYLPISCEVITGSDWPQLQPCRGHSLGQTMGSEQNPTMTGHNVSHQSSDWWPQTIKTGQRHWMKKDYDTFEKGEKWVYVIVHNSLHNPKEKNKDNSTQYTYTHIGKCKLHKIWWKTQGKKNNHYRYPGTLIYVYFKYAVYKKCFVVL